MQLVSREENYAVLDGVLEGDSYNQFCSYFNNLDFAYRNMTGWQKVWRVSDGQVLAGPAHYAFKGPHNSMIDSLSGIVGSLATQYLESIVGKKGEDWDDYFLTPYIYPAGTKISWHNDYGYSAAAIFYTHRFWDPNWGGELFIAKTSPEFDNGSCVDSVDRGGVIPVINQFGMGNYIAPLPNRLVFTKGKTWHSINRVDPTAGDALRCSIVTFFYKRNKCDAVH